MLNKENDDNHMIFFLFFFFLKYVSTSEVIISSSDCPIPTDETSLFKYSDPLDFSKSDDFLISILELLSIIFFFLPKFDYPISTLETL
jgi:hypothetical protein